MATSARRQDLPPSGGYSPLNFARKPAKQIIRPASLVLAYFVTSGVAIYLADLGIKKFRRELVEQRSSMLALLPMLTAERDRAYLKQLRKNRDEEAELMKDVDGWVVGTWYGEPCYKTLPPDTLLPTNSYEFFAHAEDSIWLKWSNFILNA